MTQEEINKERLRILNDTIAFYAEDPTNRRSIVKKSIGLKCVYKGPDGKRCAIARLCQPSTVELLVEGDSVVSSENWEIIETLEPNLANLGRSFLIKLQSLHDLDGYWTDTGLSDKGRSEVGLLKASYT